MLATTLLSLATFLSFFIDLFFLKFSAEQAYEKKVSWESAFKQWLWIIGLRLILFLGLFNIGLLIELVI